MQRILYARHWTQRGETVDPAHFRNDTYVPTRRNHRDLGFGFVVNCAMAGLRLSIDRIAWQTVNDDLCAMISMLIIQYRNIERGSGKRCAGECRQQDDL